MRSNLILVSLALALFMGKAHAINRIGNNDDVPGLNGELHDASEGFIAAIPDEFPDVNSIKDGTVQLRTMDDSIDTSAMQYASYSPFSMYASPLSMAYPQLAGLNQAQVEDFMRTQLNSQVTEIASKSCAYFLLGENAQGFIGIGKWNNHGYFLTVPRSAANSGKQGIIHILQSTKIEVPCNP
jgi:hypothetical protein